MPLIVQFSDSSTGNVKSWLWLFNDGNSSTEQNPQHVFQQIGRYVVRLTVYNDSDTDTVEGFVNVHYPQIALLESYQHGSAIAVGSINSLTDSSEDVVAVSAPRGNITWWPINPSTGAPGSPVSIDTGFYGSCALALADLDNDNYLDVIAASSTIDTIAWYKNDGNGNFGTAHIVTSTLDGVCAIAIADMDLNGTKDIVAAGKFADLVCWFSNEGYGGFASNITIRSGLDGANSVAVGDLDLDSDIDVVATAGEAGLLVSCKNDGAGNFPSGGYSTISSSYSGANYVLVTDLNSDSNLEIISCAEGLDWVSLWLNDGFGNFASQQLISSHVGGPSQVSVLDFDLDGRKDLCVTYYSANWVMWYKHYTGTPDDYWEAKNIDAVISSPQAIAAVSNPSGNLVVSGSELGNLTMWRLI